MGTLLTQRDERRLVGVHPDLVRVVRRCAATPAAPPFMVVQGLRTKEQQAHYIAIGASWTKRSRHLTGHAVDLAPLIDLDGNGVLDLSWHWPHFYPLAEAMFRAAALEAVAVEWGGHWQAKKKDGPHWQLPRRSYPA